jgi:lipid-binding SYLF domain-containing protein
MSQQPEEKPHSISTDVKATVDKTKQAVSQAQQQIEERLSMPGLLKQGLESLEAFLNPDLDIEEQIPVSILNGAKGVVFLSVVKGGLVLGGAVGTGFVTVRRDYAQGWSGPCAIGMVGVQWGFNIGVQKTDHIIVLRDDTSVKAFVGKGQLKLGADASIALGPKGRDAEVALSVNDKGYAPTASYSMAKGAYVGLSLEGQVLAIRNDCNEDYYKKKVEPSKIFDGSVEAPSNENYEAISKKLNEYVKAKGKSVKEKETVSDKTDQKDD